MSDPLSSQHLSAQSIVRFLQKEIKQLVIGRFICKGIAILLGLTILLFASTPSSPKIWLSIPVILLTILDWSCLLRERALRIKHQHLIDQLSKNAFDGQDLNKFEPASALQNLVQGTKLIPWAILSPTIWLIYGGLIITLLLSPKNQNTADRLHDPKRPQLEQTSPRFTGPAPANLPQAPPVSNQFRPNQAQPPRPFNPNGAQPFNPSNNPTSQANPRQSNPARTSPTGAPVTAPAQTSPKNVSPPPLPPVRTAPATSDS